MGLARARRGGDKKGWRRLEGLGLDEGKKAAFPSFQADIVVGMGDGVGMEVQFLIKPKPHCLLVPH